MNVNTLGLNILVTNGKRTYVICVFLKRRRKNIGLCFCCVLSKTQPREVSSKSHQIRNQIIIFYEIVPLIFISLPVIPFVFYDFPLFDIENLGKYNIFRALKHNISRMGINPTTIIE